MRDRTPLLLGALAVVVVAAAAALWLLLRSPEDQVRAAIHGGAAAASRRDVAAVMRVVDDNFRGPRGENFAVAYQAVRGTLEGYYLGGVEVEVTPEEFPVTLSHGDEEATAVFTVAARGRPSRDAPWQDVLQTWKVHNRWEVTLRLVDGDWRITSLRTSP